MTTETLIVIPARLQSSRLKHKILQDINGEPLLAHTVRCAAAANLAPILVACDDERTQSVCRSLKVACVMTDPNLPSGSDRIAAALTHYDPEKKAQRIINVQADQPNIKAQTLQTLFSLLADYAPQGDILTTLVAPLRDEDKNNPHTVKAAISWHERRKRGRAFYFSRNALAASDGAFYHHIGLYGYTRTALETLCALPPAPLERQERLEQLRALQADIPIYASLVPQAPMSIDTQDDLDSWRGCAP